MSWTQDPMSSLHGGTQLLQRGLFERLPPALRDQVNITTTRVRELDAQRPHLLWLHDLASDEHVQHLRDPALRARYAKLVFVSHWQFEQYRERFGIEHHEAAILRNAIEPIPAHSKPAGGPLRLIYHTTPHRGLQVLLVVFDFLYRNVTRDIQLDVFSSFQAYGRPDLDADYAPLFEACRRHPAIEYHGFAPNSVVRAALERAHVFAYPCIWPETSCLAAIEALSAGCSVVCPRFGALPETTHEFALAFAWDKRPQPFAFAFARELRRAIEGFWEPERQAQLALQKQVIDAAFSWQARLPEWTHLLEDLIDPARLTRDPLSRVGLAAG